MTKNVVEVAEETVDVKVPGKVIGVMMTGAGGTKEIVTHATKDPDGYPGPGPGPGLGLIHRGVRCLEDAPHGVTSHTNRAAGLRATSHRPTQGAPLPHRGIRRLTDVLHGVTRHTDPAKGLRRTRKGHREPLRSPGICHESHPRSRGKMMRKWKVPMSSLM